MRPRSRSYGDSSILTRSPGRMRTSWRRIFPEMCPSTSWSLSSFTRNIVFGRASMTSPSISIFSSLLKTGCKRSKGRGPGRRPQVAGRRRMRLLTPLESGLSGAVLEEAVDRVLQVLGGEQAGRQLADARVGATDPLVEDRAHHALRGRGGARRTDGEPLGEPERLL